MNDAWNVDEFTGVEGTGMVELELEPHPATASRPATISGAARLDLIDRDIGAVG